MNRDQVMIAASAAGFQRVLPDIEKLMLESIRLTSQPNPGPLPVGASHLGGLPDLLPGLSWPQRQGVPMSFIAQIRLEEMSAFAPAAGLPKTGLLSFFYDSNQETYGADPADRGGWQVVHLEGSPQNWHPAPFPSGLPAGAHFTPCWLIPTSEITLPASPVQVLPGLDWSLEEVQRYENFLSNFPTPEDNAALHHRMFGHPEQIQDDMQLQCALYAHGFSDLDDPQATAWLARKGDWMLLLQVDSDYNARMKWASSGMLYYWIEQPALHAAKFDQAWLVLQAE